jgi:hypothetical protein
MDWGTFAPKQSWPAIAGAAALNLIPLAGVSFWGWSAFALIFLYWAENVAIGVRTLGAMAGAAFLREPQESAAFFAMGPFFSVHYGIFCFVHGVFVLATFGGSVLTGIDIYDLAGATRSLIKAYPNMAYGLISIAGWQLLMLVLFFIGGEARRSEINALMFSPYPRIVILHITIIVGGGLVMALGQPIAGLVLLTLIKTAFDMAEASGKMTLRLPIRRPRP